MEVLVERETKTVYKEDGKTVKLFVENYSKAAILNEALNQARVEEGTDLKVPKLLEVGLINNRWALVSEHIEGIPLDKLMMMHPEKEEEYLNLFVDIQLNILSKSVPLLNRMKEKYRRKINETTLADNTKYELLQRLEGMKKHTKLCHGDYNPSNIIMKEDGTAYIIDWAHVTVGNASGDAAKAFLLFAMNNQEELGNKYLNLFSKKSGIPMSNIQQWIPIVAAVQKNETKEHQEILDRWIDVVDYN